MINELTASVPKYAHAQCLRGEIHRIVLKYLKPTKPDKTEQAPRATTPTEIRGTRDNNKNNNNPKHSDPGAYSD